MAIGPGIGTQLQIRPAERGDRSLLQELLREAMTIVLPELAREQPRVFARRVDDQFQSYFDRGDKIILVAVLDGEAVGYIWMQPMYDPLVDLKSYLIINVAVKAAHRRQGIARTLFEQARACCAEQRIPRMRLFVYGTNDGARRLYEQLGFNTGFIEMNWDFSQRGQAAPAP